MSTELAHVVRFDPRFDSITETIVDAVAEVHGLEPTQLPPLAASLDTDCLDDLAGLSAADAFERGSLTFTYAGSTVTVDLSGEVRVEPSDDASNPSATR